MTELEKYLDTKKRVEAKRRESDRLAGILEQTLSDMQRELGVSTLEEGEILLEKLRTKLTKATAARDQKLAEFNREVEGRL